MGEGGERERERGRPRYPSDVRISLDGRIRDGGDKKQPLRRDGITTIHPPSPSRPHPYFSAYNCATTEIVPFLFRSRYEYTAATTIIAT